MRNTTLLFWLSNLNLPIGTDNAADHRSGKVRKDPQRLPSYRLDSRVGRRQPWVRKTALTNVEGESRHGAQLDSIAAGLSAG